MQKEIFCAPTVYIPIRYAQGIKTTGGTIVWISGQVSQDKDGKMVHQGDFTGQARQALTNLKAMVESAGGRLDDIIKVNTYLTDLRYRADLIPIREEFFGKKTLASTLVGVTALAQPGWMIEVEAIAVI